MKMIGKISIIFSCIGICCAIAPLGKQGVSYAKDAKDDSKSSSASKDDIAASFNNTVIRKSEINKAVNSYMNIAKARKMQVPDHDKLFLMVLEAKIRTEVLKNAAKQAGIDRDKDFFKRLNDLQDQLLIELYLEKEITAKISEASLKSAYKKLSEKVSKEKEYRVRHVLVREETMAREVVNKLNKGADFAAIADQYNPTSREKGGDLGYIIISNMPEDLNKAISSLKPGEHSKEPVKSQMGYHVFKLEDARDAKVPTFEESKGRLAEIVKQEAMEALIKRLVAQAKVKVFVKGPEQTSGNSDSN